MKSNLESQIQTKINQFEKQKLQVNKHLSIIDDKTQELREQLVIIHQSLSELSREKEEITALLEHINQNIETLKSTLNIIQINKHDISKYSTENYTYNTNKRQFKGKLNNIVISILKENPTKQYRVLEIVTESFKREGNFNVKITNSHFCSVSNILHKLLEKDIVIKTKLGHKKVFWQWNQS